MEIYILSSYSLLPPTSYRFMIYANLKLANKLYWISLDNEYIDFKANFYLFFVLSIDRIVAIQIKLWFRKRTNALNSCGVDLDYLIYFTFLVLIAFTIIIEFSKYLSFLWLWLQLWCIYHLHTVRMKNTILNHK